MCVNLGPNYLSAVEWREVVFHYCMICVVYPIHRGAIRLLALSCFSYKLYAGRVDLDVEDVTITPYRLLLFPGRNIIFYQENYFFIVCQSFKLVLSLLFCNLNRFLCHHHQVGLTNADNTNPCFTFYGNGYLRFHLDKFDNSNR